MPLFWYYANLDRFDNNKPPSSGSPAVAKGGEKCRCDFTKHPPDVHRHKQGERKRKKLAGECTTKRLQLEREVRGKQSEQIKVVCELTLFK